LFLIVPSQQHFCSETSTCIEHLNNREIIGVSLVGKFAQFVFSEFPASSVSPHVSTSPENVIVSVVLLLM
jgi:hypothetical protein